VGVKLTTKWVMYMKRFFKILAIVIVVLIGIVFCLRTFFGPTHYRVKGNSMLPTYSSAEGWSHMLDFVKIELIKDGCIGCIAVFNTSTGVHISRVIAMPGDKVMLVKRDKSIKLNGIPEVYKYVGEYGRKDRDNIVVDVLAEYSTQNGQVRHNILQPLALPTAAPPNLLSANAAALGSESLVLAKGACAENVTTITCTVPEGAVFVIGDNRKTTLFGLIPESALVGISNPLKP
jgi:signal peptidase I